MTGTHNLSWFLEGRIIKAEMEGDWDEKIVAAFDQDVQRFLSQATADRVHILADVTQMHAMSSIFGLNVTFIRSPHLGWIVAYGAHTNMLVHAAASAGAKLFGVNFHEEKTLDKALAFLNRVDTTLPDLTRLAP